jgi:hypothetical protein
MLDIICMITCGFMETSSLAMLRAQLENYPALSLNVTLDVFNNPNWKSEQLGWSVCSAPELTVTAGGGRSMATLPTKGSNACTRWPSNARRAPPGEHPYNPLGTITRLCRNAARLCLWLCGAFTPERISGLYDAGSECVLS